MSENNPISDAQAVIDYVQEGEQRRLRTAKAGETYLYVDSDGGLHQHDTEPLGATPRRSRGTVKVHSAVGFVGAVNDRTAADGSYGLYANLDDLQLTAVLNDDTPLVPGWRDYRVDLALRPTKEWEHWRKHQGLGTLAAFAEAIEEGLPEVVRPQPATMLELAQTFSATSTAKFKQGAQLTDGRRQYLYEEDIDSRAGNAGTIEIPDTFELRVSPFLGTPAESVECRLRRRLREGVLQIGYEIVRPHEVERAGFEAIKAEVEVQLDHPVIEGIAPAPLR